MSGNVGLEVLWDDPAAVVEAILQLRAQPGLPWQMGADGYKVALRDYQHGTI